MLRAFYRPDKTARAFWLGRLESEYPVEVLKAGEKKMPKAVIRTQKKVVMAVSRYAIIYQKA